MEIRLCVLKGLFGMIDIGIYGSLLVKKFRNWKTGIHTYKINAHGFLINRERLPLRQLEGC